ncbi:triggering receptor expressed on myeloid cells 2 [Danio rerio]|uniref:Triggering receptor expressed on myeloid cells 2 n=1 Tax=Danio rerio TaxID=7955 RepID=A0A8M3AYE0_DANRE
MTVIIIFISMLAVFHQDCRGQVTVTQTPLITAQPGQDVRISCKASRPVHLNDHVAWYLSKPGEAIKILIYRAKHRFIGVPSEVTGSGHGADFTLTISGVQPKDAGLYICQSDHTGAIDTQ